MFICSCGIDSATQRRDAVGVIASVAFRNFKALRNTSLALAPFNLVIGPNGSGKTSLIQALLRLRTLSRLPLREPVGEGAREIVDGPDLTFRFLPPHEDTEAVMSCVSDVQCDLLQISPLRPGDAPGDWPALRARLQRIRGFAFDDREMAAPSPARQGGELAANGSNLAAVLAGLRVRAPAALEALRKELCRILPEYDDFSLEARTDGTVELALRLAEDRQKVTADNLSEGTLYLLAMLTLAFDPEPPSIAGFEEIDRGFHPRLLREVRDVLYRLSHPQSFGLERAPVQVVATTHSPYLLDLFREHPEEIVISEKRGAAATFSRLGDRADLRELLQDGSLGDLWFSGILGGVPQE